MDKKKILLIGLFALAIIILIVSFIKFSKKENTKINNVAPIENTDNQIKSEEQVEVEKGIISSTTVNLISDQQLDTLSAEKKEEVLNMRVATPENIETVTGIKKDSKSAQPIVENGIIVGVPTGISPVSAPTTNVKATNTNTTGSSPAPSYVDEFEAIRNQKK